MDRNKTLYSFGRVEAALKEIPEPATPAEIIQALHRDVQRFVDGAPAFDDLTLLCVRWRGEAFSER